MLTKKIQQSRNVENAKQIYQSFMQAGTGYVDDNARKLFNTWQPRTKGYQFQAQSTPTDIGNLSLSGTAKMFLGFVFRNTQPGDVFTLNLNEEIICTDANAQTFDNSVVFASVSYFEFMRFLTGKDTLNVTYSGSGAQIVEVEFFYI